MGIWSSFAGNLRVKITAASPTDILTAVNAAGITLRNIDYIDELSVEADISRFCLQQLKTISNTRGGCIEVRWKQGIYWGFIGLFHRPILIAGMLLLFVLSIYLPGRILFVQVEGNSAVKDHTVLEQAEKCGVYFGAPRRGIRSEKVKNTLLASIPELQWTGVNTYGCVAVISVKERSVAEERESMEGVTSIVAARDGVILQSTVTQGNALCKVGQAVKEGQILVSGYTDYGICVKGTRAQAEIYAQTLREMEAIALAPTGVRTEIVKKETRYSLLIGKKLINFFKDSGISDATCAKMYSIRYLTLPGGFLLPVALRTEELTYYRQQTASDALEDHFDWLYSYSESYLQSNMVAGKILRSDVSVELQDGICSLNGKYACSEMIGRVRNEEITQNNGKND